MPPLDFDGRRSEKRKPPQNAAFTDYVLCNGTVLYEKR
jgi:hypothetical protein